MSFGITLIQIKSCFGYDAIQPFTSNEGSEEDGRAPSSFTSNMTCSVITRGCISVKEGNF